MLKVVGAVFLAPVRVSLLKLNALNGPRRIRVVRLKNCKCNHRFLERLFKRESWDALVDRRTQPQKASGRTSF